MSGFMTDVAAEPAVVRRVAAGAGGHLGERIDAAAAILRDRVELPVVVTGMGSSLSAGRVLHAVLVPAGRIVILEDAGELLHYGMGAAARVGCLVAVSQSGRSAETARVVERFRSIGVPIIAVVNDAESPVAAAADVVLDIGAGAEAAVATRTFVASVAVLALVAGRVVAGGPTVGDLAAVADEMDLQLHEDSGTRAARHLAGCRAILVVGRGPALGAADYAALTIKETAAIPAESMSGGAFRHGPLELAAADAGFVVIAPAGPTAAIAAGVAREVAALGRPTWLLASAGLAGAPDDPPTLLSAGIPDLHEALAPLTCAVPLQQAAQELARAAGRQAGVTVLATKVTDRE